jgi:hypothetical protein
VPAVVLPAVAGGGGEAWGSSCNSVSRPWPNFNLRKASAFFPLCFHCKGKGKGNTHPRTGHESPELE